MALVLKDRVKETSTTAGTGTITLAGAVAGFQSFSAVGNGNTTYYAIVDTANGDWEVGIGTYTASGTTLSRDTVLSSSNSGSLVSFAANQKDVFVTYPSEKSVYEDASNVVNATSFGAITATSAALTTGTVSTTPASNTDIANKQYVDGLVTQGISYHEPVYVESPNTAGNLNATYNNGASGVGATLTNAGTQVALTVDGILMTVGKRVLIYNQTNAAQNGVYTVTTVGSGSTNWVLTRATDANTYGLRDPNALGYNDAFFVTNGDTGAGETYVCTTTGTITFGTTNITFAQISSAQVYTAGTGLNLSPATTFNISNTGVTAATYGSASAVPVFAVNAQGQITGVTNTNIAISGSAVSGNISGSAGSVANALTAGSFLTSTGTFDGSVARTFAVDAVSTNTASKVVARDGSGDFSAGTITAALSGNATTATTATNVAGGAANQIVYNTAAGTTSFVTAPTTSGTYLGWDGSAFTYSAISLPNTVTFNSSGTGDASGTTFNGSVARTISYNTVGASPLAGSSSLTTTGTVSSGTWSASFGAVSGANLTNLTAANISGTVAVTNGGSGASTASGARTNFGATTLGSNLFTITNPSAVTFPQFNADNTVSALDAASFRSAIGAGTSSATGTVTSITAGSYLTGGTITTSGTIAVDATNLNTASKVVARDASGNFSAGTITASLSGNATTASSLNNALTLGSYLTGTSYNGSSAVTAAVDATSANTASKVVARDGSGNFSAGTITASLSGNATTATSATNASNVTGGNLSGLLTSTVTPGSTVLDLATNDGYASARVIRNSSANPGTVDGMFIGYANSGSGSTRIFGGGATSGGIVVNGSGVNNVTIAGNIALNAGNYNSYAPTLTGTGASGTWGINVTGSAGSASTATSAASLVNGTNSITKNASYGWNVRSDQATTSILLLDSAGTGRGWWYADSSSNQGFLSSSGSWMLQVTNAGNVTATTSSRAPIFYDSDNTGYYLDPNSTSRLGGVNADSLRSYTNVYTDGNYGYGLVGVYSSTRFQGVFSMGSAYALAADGTTTGNLYGIAWSYPSAGGAAGNLASHGMLILENGVFKGAWGGGSLRTPGDVRGTIFYDWDNTGYYLDPASSSVLNTIYQVGVYTRNSAGTGYLSGNYSSSETSSTTGAIYTIGGSYYPTSTSFNTMYGIGYCYADGISVGISGASSWGMYVNASGANNVWLGGATGQVISTGDHRGTLFYDYNNTGYYVDPASTSNLYALTVNQTISGSVSGSAATATNVAGGAAGNIHYQSATGTTAFVTNGTAGQVLTSNGSGAPTWSSASGGVSTGKSIALAMVFGY